MKPLASWLVFLWCPLAALAQPAADQPMSTASVLAKMHQVNQMEMELGRLAEHKGHAKHVRAFGARLARDHAFADRKVLGLARAEGLKLAPPAPMTPDREQAAAQQQALVARLQQASGPAFDAAYLSAMVTGHGAAIQMLTQAEDETRDTKLRSLLSRMIPILKQHLQVAKNLGGKPMPMG